MFVEVEQGLLRHFQASENRVVEQGCSQLLARGRCGQTIVRIYMCTRSVDRMCCVAGVFVDRMCADGLVIASVQGVRSDFGFTRFLFRVSARVHISSGDCFGSTCSSTNYM